MAAGAVFHDRAQVLDFFHTPQRIRILPDQVYDFFEKLGTRHDFTTAEIHQTFIQSVTLSTPAVFFYQHGRILAPALVVLLQPVEHAQHAQVQRGHGNGVVEARTDIGDPHFQGRVPVAGADIPPQFGGVLYQARLDQGVNVALVFRPRIKGIGQAGPGHFVEHAQAVRFQARVFALPERR